ncbi:HepT-like ribonuclease domain-containing protein [Rhizobium sp. P32RR-XVIII]|uniref:HepT-like ribonuclease domain-containing protein n=1 Tax=Rhizobium sp. P32RR-XVIII TaxID=2726738 RepID=UPI0028A5D606|nr:HepT-like ribonuclease domain-containing protein [Rhizobium sp. P32RR-XVIII]
MARDIHPVLDDIIETIALIENAVQGKTRDDFGRDRLLGLGIQRAIEIISEASRHIPDELLQHAPEIPWRSIRGIGNILRHEYHHIADDVIWDVVLYDLPPLKAAVQSLQTKAAEE